MAVAVRYVDSRDAVHNTTHADKISIESGEAILWQNRNLKMRIPVNDIVEIAAAEDSGTSGVSL